MDVEAKADVNVKQAVPFFAVSDMQASLRFYMDGLEFKMKYKWIDKGVLRWCWLEIGEAALMLQEYRKEGHDSWVPESKVGVGVTISFQCADALKIYREMKARGIQAQMPVVGNHMWVTGVSDPDGYRLEFESPTDVPEDTVWSEDKG